MHQLLQITAIYFLLFLPLSVYSTDFGYVSFSQPNIGDDIQSLAAKRLLPPGSIPIDREYIGRFKHPRKVHTLVYGWFMKKVDRRYNWPPSKSIEPFFLSLHLTDKFIFKAVKVDKKFLLRHGPVGARDYSTLNTLRNANIPCYYSGCITLTLDNPHSERDDIIYLVDLDQELVDYIRERTAYKVVVLSHIFDKDPFMSFDHAKRLEIAESFIDRYCKAKCVITSRLHAAMPCLPLGTPVLLVNLQYDQYRFEGPKDLIRNCSKEELLSGQVDFNFNDPSPNSDAYVPLRENLLYTIQEWVSSSS